MKELGRSQGRSVSLGCWAGMGVMSDSGMMRGWGFGVLVARRKEPGRRSEYGASKGGLSITKERLRQTS